ncbi:uncharacterized protein MKZ38_003706 [Zalerion maritima]|uniref:Uncharacterized protein n=1 Tax=Zalerion maritima TaxID=339359 RepID=A0AAD5WV54_9PEZI|nr:uncharacterized protein MKZ38_003706 [Zalerion maritima]
MVVQCSSGLPGFQSPIETLAPWDCHRPSSFNKNDDMRFLDDTPFPPLGSMTPGSDSDPKARSQEILNSKLRASRELNDSKDGDKGGNYAFTTVRVGGQPTLSTSQSTSSVYVSTPSATGLSASIPQNAASSSKPFVRSEMEQSSPLPSPAPTASPITVSFRPSQKLSQKRRRPLTDVDGIDTAELSVKKRRLRLHLITSRLSRPFSLPATHILNREAIAGLPGDGKRFVKLAAYLSARRAAVSAAQSTSINHNPSSVDLLRRAAILNRVRVGVAKLSTAVNHIYGYAYSPQSHGMEPRASTAALVACHSVQLVNAARYFFPSPTTPAAPPPQHQNTGPVGMASQWHYHHTPSHVHAASGPPSMSQHYGALLPRTPPPAGETPSPTKPGMVQKMEYHHARLPPSPKLKPSSGGGARRLGPSPLACSPDLRPARERDFDENDEVDNDSVAFPGSEVDNKYADLSDDDEDGDDDGYDFGAIFGGSTGTMGNQVLTPDDLDELEFGMLDDPSDDTNGHFYEEYLDELDGIPRGSSRA